LLALEYISGFLRRHPIFPTFATPSYTDAAYAILGLVIEAVTGKTYDEAVSDSILKPLNLTRTTVRVPSDASGNNVIIDRNYWRWDLGVENPYASPSPNPLPLRLLSIPLPRRLPFLLSAG
jgi:CubicO group peptidase (beta-lactamase class C family)